MAVQKTVKISPFFNFFIQFAIVAVVFFAIGFAVGQKKVEFTRHGFVPQIHISNQLPPQSQNIDFSLFWKVLDTLPQKYIDKSAIDGQKILYGAISGMVKSLGDPYTAFLDPKQNEAISEELSGSYEGVGIQIGFNQDKRLAVIAPLKGTPAEKAGVLPKDLILKIGDKDTFDMTLPEAVDLIRGPAGSKIKLSLEREKDNNKAFDVEIERAKIDVKSVEVEYRQSLSANKQSFSANRPDEKGEIAVIKVSRFGEKTNSEWDSAVLEVSNRQVKGIILDLRNNPGGLLTSAIHIASDFMRGTVVKEEFSNGTVRALASDHEGKLMKIPMVVLVNGGSASASEIVAGAIKDSGRGKVIGEKTFGKGTVQEPIELPGGSGLHVTVAKWLTPKGSSIHGKGISPDTEVEISTADRDNDRDPQLDKSIDQLK